MKNREKAIILFATYLLLLTACHSKVRKMEESNFVSTEEYYNIEVKPNDKAIDIKQYIDSVFYVKLELSDESIIGHIDKIVCFENRIYIMDKQTSSLFMFDMKGKYLSKICKIGNGPGEYTTLNYFDIDIENRQIVLIDLMTYWCIRYDLSGKYISRKRIPVNMEGFAPVSTGKYVSFSNFRDNLRFLDPEYNIIYLDSLMQIEKVFFPYNSSNFFNPFVQFPGKPGGPFYTFNDEIYFMYKMKSEVYKVAPEGLSLKYKFDFNGKNFDYSAINNKRNLHDYLYNGNYLSLHNVCETAGILSFSFFENIDSKAYTGFYSKHTGNIINSSFFSLNKVPFSNLPIASYADWFICELSIDNLIQWKINVDAANDMLKEKGYKGGDLFLEHKALIEMKRLADSLTLDDNSVLMFFKLKSF